MKKLLVIIFIFFTFAVQKSEASIVVQSSGNTVVSATQISQPINVTINELLNVLVTLNVKALDSYITNTSDSSLRIPVSQLYLNDGTTSYQMQYNTNVSILSSILTVATYTRAYTAVVTNVSAIPAGTYTTRLQFTLNSTLSTQTTTFTLSFTIPVDQSVSTITSPVTITLTPDNVFDTSANIANTTSPQINIKSNTKWKLLMDTSSLGTLAGNYYFQVLSATGNVNEYSSTPVKINANQQYTLAKGKGTYTTPITGGYSNDYIILKYYLLNNSGSYLQEGTYNNYVKYILQEDN